MAEIQAQKNLFRNHRWRSRRQQRTDYGAVDDQYRHCGYPRHH